MKTNAIGINISQGRKERALTKHPTLDYFDKFLHGSTYVPLEAAMSMQKEIGDECIIAIGWNNGNTTHCKRNWIQHPYPCQKLDKESYGAKFVPCPSFNPKLNEDNTDARLLWVVCSILTRVKELWISTDNCIMHQSTWYGWILVSKL